MNETITTKNYKKLSLQISLTGLSYCCFDTLNWEITAYNSIKFEKYKSIEDQLWKIFLNHTELTRQYDEIMVLHDNNFNTFVPNALFDEMFLGSYLQYNTKVFESDFFTYDAIGSYDINNVYVPLMNVNNFLIDQFGTFEYKHVNSILTGKLLDVSRNIEEKQVFVHLQATHFEIVVVRNQKLLLYNSFEYNTPEDFLYYLLFTMEQLFLNPEMVKVLLLGDIDEDGQYFAIAYKYIRNVMLLDTSALEEKYSIENKEALKHFILFNS